jgi:hypothetical protein
LHLPSAVTPRDDVIGHDHRPGDSRCVAGERHRPNVSSNAFVTTTRLLRTARPLRSGLCTPARSLLPAMLGTTRRSVIDRMRATHSTRSERLHGSGKAARDN